MPNRKLPVAGGSSPCDRPYYKTITFQARSAAKRACLSSVAPEYSRGRARDIEAAGGRFVEAPVSGSRVPAERGELVAMLGGEAGVRDAARGLLSPMCHEAVYCGPAGQALLMKLAVNLFMLVTAVGLAETVHFADRQGLDRLQLQARGRPRDA